MEDKLLFALDIGTRSVVGLVGERIGSTIKLLAVERLEHHTRAMLDGQIHDVPEVAKVLATVKMRLEESCGPLKKVSVAAAGRALCTITAQAEIEATGRGVLSSSDEQSLELAAIQAAQHQLATSTAVADPTSYYCVGYSVISFFLDGTSLKSLVGQRGKAARIEMIATFLPRQVIDSLQSALTTAGLEMSTLTLEPIAAINVLIPPTMRHLNLTLVDVGAGTSDVAITRDGSVSAYGMVPCAGDEITEAISQKYLLDFNVAENLKRQLNGKNKKLSYKDVLGISCKVSASEVLEAIAQTVGELAQAIAKQILTLNTTAPQAVLLVGGGALTPMLPEALAQALDVPLARVAIRNPDVIEGLSDIPKTLCTPDAVTPLGILKLADSRTLNFVNVTLNDQALHIFNLGNLTVADALLAAGIDVRSLHGRPGLGITISINGQTKFIPGTHGKPSAITVNNQEASFSDKLNENDVINVTKGTCGTAPNPTVAKVVDIPATTPFMINGIKRDIPALLTVDGKKASPNTKLTDRSQVICRLPTTLEEVLELAKCPLQPVDYSYTINGSERIYSIWPTCYISNDDHDDILATASTPLQADDNITLPTPTAPTLGELLGLTDPSNDMLTIRFNGTECSVPIRRYTITIGGESFEPSDIAVPDSIIEFSCYEQSQPNISDVLLAADFNPRLIPPTSTVKILLNEQNAEYTSIVKNGDAIDIVIQLKKH